MAGAGGSGAAGVLAQEQIDSVLQSLYCALCYELMLKPFTLCAEARAPSFFCFLPSCARALGFFSSAGTGRGGARGRCGLGFLTLRPGPAAAVVGDTPAAARPSGSPCPALQPPSHSLRQRTSLPVAGKI